VILPGVGAFAPAIERLEQLGLSAVLKEIASQNKPLLGICLGMQLLFEEGHEGGLVSRGLGLLPGRVREMGPGIKLPHMGWNTIKIVRQDPLLRGIKDGQYFYFVHSYQAELGGNSSLSQESLLARATYGQVFPAVVGRNSVWGTQFHPEKSSSQGLQILSNFVDIVYGS
jgi:glutamine amidotransferase